MMSDSEAGPSSAAVVFKKRAGRPKGSAPRNTTIVKSESPAAGSDTIANEERTRDEKSSGKATPHHTDEEDETTQSLEDLVRLRALRAKPTGISIERLNKGEARKKKKGKKDPAAEAQKSAEDRWAEQMERGGLVSISDLRGKGTSQAIQTDADSSDDDDDDEAGRDGKGEPKVHRLASQANFTEEKATVDVDKHMMAFIEEEMRKRRQQEQADAEINGRAGKASSGDKPALGSLDELYSISEKYKQIQQSAREAIARSKGRPEAGPLGARAGAEERDDGQERERLEGNVALSTSMLTSVPEIDLGMDNRIKNIEATERARRAMEAAAEAQRIARQNRGEDDDDDLDYGAARFFRHSGPVLSDLERARAEEAERLAEAGETAVPEPPRTGDARRRQTATDDAARDRFKKRQRNQLKR